MFYIPHISNSDGGFDISVAKLEAVLTHELLAIPEVSNGPSSILRTAKLTWDAASLSKRWFVNSFWLSAWLQLEQHQGSLTALMCLDSVLDEQRPFGAPNCWMRKQ